jgi:hypothetical protein
VAELCCEEAGTAARLIGASANRDMHATARAMEKQAAESNLGIGNIISEPPGVSHAKLELAVAGVELVMMNWNSVIQADRSNGKVQAQTNAPVIAKIIQRPIIRIGGNIADVVEDGKAHADSVLLFDDGDAVFGRPEPIGITTNGFRESGLSRANAIEFETAQ